MEFFSSASKEGKIKSQILRRRLSDLLCPSLSAEPSGSQGMMREGRQDTLAGYLSILVVEFYVLSVCGFLNLD